KQELVAAAHVVTPRVESLHIRRARCRKNRTGHRPAFAILVSDSTGQEGGSPIAPIPKKARPRDPPRVTRQVRPAISVTIVPLLPVASSQDRDAPARRKL